MCAACPRHGRKGDVLSTVHARKRNLSEYEFFANALTLKAEVNRVAMSEKVIPKKYRFSNGIPLIEMARSVVYNINRADCFYPNSSFNALERKRYLTLAIADCEQLMLGLQSLMGPHGLCLPIDANKLEPLVEMVEREIQLLRGVRKNVRVTGERTIDDRIRDARDEIERLEALQ